MCVCRMSVVMSTVETYSIIFANIKNKAKTVT